MEGLNFDPTPSAPTLSPKRRNPKRFLILVAAIVVILILLFGAFNLLGGSNNNSDNITPTPTEFITETPTPTESLTPTETPTLTATPTPTTTPKPTAAANSVDSSTGLDRANLKVTVENGSGVTGAAATAKDYLVSLGYNVISTGNADTTDFTNVTIQVKSTKTNYLSLLKKDLSSKYTVGTTSSDLDSSASEDALVIIGK